MINKTFRPMKPKRVDEIGEYDGRIFQEKIDGGNSVVDVDLPNINIIHARDKTWNIRTYRYPELVKEIQQGKVLRNKCTYIGELTVLDKDGVGRLWTFGKRSHLENQFQIRRLSKIYPVVFYPHHIIQDNGEMLDTLTYEEIMRLLATYVNEGDHVKQIPTFENPQPLLEQKGKIEGMVIKELSGIYQFGKRGSGWTKKKFLQEKTVKFISYIEKEIGINLFTDDNKEIHLSGNRVKLAVEQIEQKGYVMAEIEFYAETDKGFRDASIKSDFIKRIGNLKEAEI